jgi:hypothetical protein
MIVQKGRWKLGEALGWDDPVKSRGHEEDEALSPIKRNGNGKQQQQQKGTQKISPTAGKPFPSSPMTPRQTKSHLLQSLCSKKGAM